MICISDIVDALSGGDAAWRTLKGVEPHMRDSRPAYVTGNAAVTIFVRHRGCEKVIKCYTRENPHLAAIYGRRFLPRELCVFDLTGRPHRIDCLVTDLVEGTTLDCAICSAAPDTLHALAAAFDAMAVDLLAREYAHGDLKPENIIVKPDGSMVPIDWDSAFVPQLAGRLAPEIGTAAYQHPRRTRELFDKHIDDYSIALLSVLLHAAAVDTATAEHYRTRREFALRPREVVAGTSREMERLTDLFASRGMAVEYRLARMLASPIPQLFGLAELMECTRPVTARHLNAQPVADVKDGLWGCRADGQWIIPPLYDRAFDPTEGTMLAGLGPYDHFLSTDDGRCLISLGRDQRAKPLRNGCTTVHGPDSAPTILKLHDPDTEPRVLPVEAL